MNHNDGKDREERGQEREKIDKSRKEKEEESRFFRKLPHARRHEAMINQARLGLYPHLMHPLSSFSLFPSFSYLFIILLSLSLSYLKRDRDGE